MAYFLTLGWLKDGLNSSRASSTFIGLQTINISRAAVDSWACFQLTLFRNLANAWGREKWEFNHLSSLFVSVWSEICLHTIINYLITSRSFAEWNPLFQCFKTLLSSMPYNPQNRDNLVEKIQQWSWIDPKGFLCNLQSLSSEKTDFYYFCMLWLVHFSFIFFKDLYSFSWSNF